VEILSRK